MNTNIRRKNRVRFKLKKISSRKRLSIFKSNNHLYVQIINDAEGITLASASTLEKSFKSDKFANKKEMAEESNKKAIKRIVRTITLTEEDLSKLDGIERVISAHGHRIKTDSKLIRAAISIANKSVNNKPYNIDEVAEKVISEDGRTLFRGMHGE